MNEFRWIMTVEGLIKHAVAEAGTTPIDLSTGQFAVGDGSGAYHDPEELLDGLINERWRGAINQVYQHPDQQDLVVIEAVIPAEVGGWDIREAAIYDAAGALILVGKYPLTPKPLPDSGAAKVIIVRGGMRFSNGLDAVLQIPGDMVMASRDYVDAHTLLTNPHLATNLATPDRLMLRDATGRAKVTAPLADDDIARKDTVTAAITALVNSAPAPLDTLYELAAALGNDANFATTMVNALAGKSATSHNHSGVYLPLNGQAADSAKVGGQRVMHGTVDFQGNITSGSGFTVVKNGTGDFTVTIISPFGGVFTPVASLTTGTIGNISIVAWYTSNNTFNVVMTEPGSVRANTNFGFVAVGPA